MDESEIVGLFNTARALTYTVKAGFLFSCLIVLVKLLRRPVVQIFNIPIDLGRTCYLFVGLTVAHMYYAVVFIRRCRRVFCEGTSNQRMEAWNKLTQGDLVWFNEVTPRAYPVDGTLHVYPIDPTDPTSWLAVASILLLVLATVRLASATWLTRIGTVVAATLLARINWMLGANWVVAASQLTIDGESPYFHFIFGNPCSGTL